MQSFAEALKAYTRDHPFDTGNGDAETVLDQLYQAWANIERKNSSGDFVPTEPEML